MPKVTLNLTEIDMLLEALELYDKTYYESKDSDWQSKYNLLSQALYLYREEVASYVKKLDEYKELIKEEV